MKNVMKKMLLVCLVASFAASAFGCNKNNNEEDLQIETISLDQTKQDLTFTYGQGAGPAVDVTEAAEGDEDENAEDVEAFEEVTELVDVTDDGGQAVTDAEGAVQTQTVVVETRPATISSPGSSSGGLGGNGSSGNSGNGNSGNAGNSGSGNSGNGNAGNSGNGGSGNAGGEGGNQTPANNYTPAYDTCKAYWLDMSQEGDYFFNGEFLIITFEVNEDTPDGSYPVSIATTDIASWELVSYDPVKINGEVAVNSQVATQEDASGNDFTLKVNSTSAKQGEMATVVVDLSNNPGFCGFVIDIQYDANALTIVDATGGADFNKTVSSVN